MGSRKGVKNKRVTDLGIKDSYLHYKDKCKGSPVKYKEYCKILKECNLELLNQAVNESNNIKLPYRLGDLNIRKVTRNYGADRDKWAIDYERTKREGFVIYFDQKYLYKWVWDKAKCIVIHKSVYKFVTARKARRMVAPALRSGVDYFKIK